METTLGPLRVVDLFCGAGGLSEGFRAAGFEIAFALDRDKDAMATFSRNHRGVPTHVGSITDLTPAQIAEKSAGRVDVIVGGPSCQGFSTANRGRASGDDRNELWTHMMAVVDELKPRAFVLENVPGMVQFRAGGLGAEVVEGFENLGYVVQHRILLAADYGVPQRRRRLFIVGVRSEREFEFPQPTHHGAWRRDSIEMAARSGVVSDLLPHVSCWEAIADLPAVTEDGDVAYRPIEASTYASYMRRGLTHVSAHVSTTLGESHAALISRVPQGGTWRDVPAHLLPPRFLNMRRTDSTNLLGRLDPRLPSYTITTQFTNVTGGCNTHPFENRTLSIREGARLQSFPDDYEFEGTNSSRARQIGNAVPPMLAQGIARQIALALLHPVQASVYAAPPVIKPCNRVAPAMIDPLTKKPRLPPERVDSSADGLIAAELAARGIRVIVGGTPAIEDEDRRAADLLMPEERLAVLINGCFLDGCDEHASKTRSSTFWWAAKIKESRARYEKACSSLEDAGWEVLTVWEHENPRSACDRIEATLNSMRPEAGPDQLTG